MEYDNSSFVAVKASKRGSSTPVWIGKVLVSVVGDDSSAIKLKFIATKRVAYPI